MPHDPITWGLILYGAMVAGGITAAWQGRLVVFTDLSDLVTTFAIAMAAVLAAYLLLGSDRVQPQFKGWWVIGIAAAALGAVAYRSWVANGSVPAAVLALLIKLPFAILVPLLVLQVAAPRGKTASDRAGSRASALILLAIIAPLLLVLVRDKNGMRRYLGVA